VLRGEIPSSVKLTEIHSENHALHYHSKMSARDGFVHPLYRSSSLVHTIPRSLPSTLNAPPSSFRASVLSSESGGSATDRDADGQNRGGDVDKDRKDVVQKHYDYSDPLPDTDDEEGCEFLSLSVPIYVAGVCAVCFSVC